MATNQTGIAIVIKAWLPVTGPISEQIAKLQMVEAAHSSGDYAELLKASSVDEIKTEQKTRRIEEAPTTTQPPVENDHAETSAQQSTEADAEASTQEETQAEAEPALRQRKAPK